MKFKIAKAVFLTITALIGSCISVAPVLIGILWDDLPHPWVLLLAWAGVGASNYAHTFIRTYNRVQANHERLNAISYLYGIKRNDGESDEELMRRISETLGKGSK